jgi:phospholipase A1
MKIFILVLLLASSAFAEVESSAQRDQIREEEHFLLQKNEPIYFLYGRPDSKIELSFKIKLLDDYPLFFRYNQLIFWDLQERSQPFRDTNLNPELVYVYDIPKNVLLDNIDFGIFEHKSNGRDGDPSRSFNRVYVRFNFLKEFDSTIVSFSTKLGYMFNLGPTNTDIRDYESPLQLRAAVTKIFDDTTIQRMTLDMTYFPGGAYAQRWRHGGFETGLNMRVKGFAPALYIQYYHGYAESLISYNHSVSHIRGGLSF